MGRSAFGRGKKRLDLALAGHFGAGNGRFPAELGYINEMGWLKERGLISCWADYRNLPARVLHDARMVMYHEAVKRQSDLNQQTRRGRR